MGVIKEVLVPDIGDFKGVDVIEILVKPGDRVETEGSLVTLESDKATMEIPSPAAGIVRELVLDHPGAFLTPEACIGEVWENREDWNRKKVPEASVKEALDFLTEEFVTVVPRSVYRGKEEEAATLIRDPDDVPVVALALAVENEGIWTFNTKDFSGPLLTSRCRVLTTSAVKSLLMEL